MADKRQELLDLVTEAGDLATRERMQRELRDPRSEATGAFAEWLLEGAAEVIQEQSGEVAELCRAAVDLCQRGDRE